MDWQGLQRCITRWEDVHTEFKEWPVHSDDIAAALVAFANTDGGQFILGVDNGRQIIGVDDPDAAMQRVDQIAYNNCEPPLTVIQETVKSDSGAVVLVVNVPKGDQRPYRTNRGVYYICTTSGRRQASRQELLRLFQSAESLFYDETAVLRASLTDLDRSTFENFVQQAINARLRTLVWDTSRCWSICAWPSESKTPCIPIWPPCCFLAGIRSAFSPGFKLPLPAYPAQT